MTGVWVGCEDRSAHFRTLALGQGANMALPIWGLYMQKVYADPSLHISKRDFDVLSKPRSVDWDCDESNTNAIPQQGKRKKKKIDTDEF